MKPQRQGGWYARFEVGEEGPDSAQLVFGIVLQQLLHVRCHGVHGRSPRDGERLGRAAGDHELHDEHEGLLAVPAQHKTA